MFKFVNFEAFYVVMLNKRLMILKLHEGVFFEIQHLKNCTLREKN